MKPFIPCTNLSFSFSLRPINLHQLSPQKNAEICLVLVLGRFWPWLPRKSSNLFSLLLSQPSHRFTSFLHVSLYLSNPEEALLSTQHFHLPPPLSYLLPSTILPITLSLSHLREGLISLYQSKNSWNLHNPAHHPLVFPTYEKAFFLSINPKTVKIYTILPIIP